MAVKFSYVHKEDHIATKICEGYYEGVVYQVGRIQFSKPSETGHRGMRFKYQILQNPNNVEIKDDITSIIGDIIVEQIEQKLEEGEMVYANGKD